MIIAPEEIEDRLRALPAAIVMSPEDSRAVARLDELSAPRERAQVTVPRTRLIPAVGAVAGFLVFVVLANIVAVYFAPAYGRALADAPGIGPASSRMLAAVGLSTGDVVGLNDVATSSGHTIRLVGGYADALRTELFLTIDGRGMTGDPKAFGRNPGDYGPFPDSLTLTDQFGHSYNMAGVNGGTTLGFEALRWPSSQVGARLTLHLTGLIAIWNLKSGPLNPSVIGDWTLHATLIPQPASSVTLPPPLVLPNATYTFTSIKASGKTMTIRYSVSGPLVAQVLEDLRKGLLNDPNQGPGADLEHAYLWPQMFDAAGNRVQTSDWGFTFPKSSGEPIAGDIDAFIPGPGNYKIQFGYALGEPQYLRWIVVSTP